MRVCTNTHMLFYGWTKKTYPIDFFSVFQNMDIHSRIVFGAFIASSLNALQLKYWKFKCKQKAKNTCQNACSNAVCVCCCNIEYSYRVKMNGCATGSLSFQNQHFNICLNAGDVTDFTIHCIACLNRSVCSYNILKPLLIWIVDEPSGIIVSSEMILALLKRRE